LLTFPQSNPAREQLGRGLRVTFHGHYAIYYLIRKSAVIIVRVLHGARDAAAIADRGVGFSEFDREQRLTGSGSVALWASA
jgi:toxin ParE1/3/4